MGKFSTIKIAGICGVLSSIVIFLTIQLAIFDSPWFRWTQHALSDLGVEGLSAFIFNNGLILAGIFSLAFSLGLSKILVNKLGAYLLGFSSLSLIGVGLFPKTIFMLHYISSAAFFLLVVLALFLIGIAMKQNHLDDRMGMMAILFALFACCSPFFLNLFGGIAIPEMVVVFPAFLWCMMYGLKITIQNRKHIIKV